MKKEYALVTGASSGIGREVAIELSKRGYDLILVARRKDRLIEISQQLDSDCRIITADLSDLDEVHKLYKTVKDENITVLVNSAGFGLLGDFASTKLDRELNMINLNISALHLLTKLFLKDFIKRDTGYILNVASSAGLMPAGPYMATYYASKAYVTSLTQAISQELRDQKSNVVVSALCPGPVDTEFNDVAGVSFGLPSISALECARYGLRHLFNGKTIIVPGATMKAATAMAKLLPRRLVVSVAGHQQKKKRDNQ